MLSFILFRDAALQDFINSQDSSGHCALYLAAKNSHRDCCQHLLEKGAKIGESFRDLLFELGLIEPPDEGEESGDEDKSSTSSRQRYGVDETDESEKIEDLDLGERLLRVPLIILVTNH